MTNSINEIEFADCIFIIGSNTTAAHPLIGWRVRSAKDRGAKIITADPRITDVAALSDIHLQLEPGTDILLLNAMMNTIINENLLNAEFIKNRTEGFEGIKETVASYTPEKVASRTGLNAIDIKAAARIYARCEKSSILYTLGITEHICGTHNVMSIANLAMLTGQIGRESTGVNPLRGQNNVQGACDMAALPTFLPGYQKYNEPDINRKFSSAWKVDSLPTERGLTLSEMFPAASEGKLKGIFEMGEDPLLSDPNRAHIKHGLESLEFLMVQDIFMSETAKMADLILPAASFAEKDGTFTNSERRVQLVRKAIEPANDCRADWEIICLLAEKMGYSMHYEHPSQIMDEIAELTPSYGGISYDRISKTGLQWPCPDKYHSGTEYLHKGSFARGKGAFQAIHHVEPAEPVDSDYPLILSTGRILFQYNAGTMTRRTSSLERENPENFVQIHPYDAEKYNIHSGDMLTISTRRGSINAKAEVTENTRKGVIWMAFHFAEEPANTLTIDAFDPIAKTAEYKVCAARIEVKK